MSDKTRFLIYFTVYIHSVSRYSYFVLFSINSVIKNNKKEANYEQEEKYNITKI